MFGLIHECMRQLVLRNYGGEAIWHKIVERAGFEAGKENILNHYYPDSDTFTLFDCCATLLKMSREQVLEKYGEFFIKFVMLEMGWDELLRSISPNMKGFLDSLDSLHYFIDHGVYKANLHGPSFRTEENSSENTITLHYFTERPGLYPIAKGILLGLARLVFQLDVSITIDGRTQRTVQTARGERLEGHVIFLIKDLSASRNFTGRVSISSEAATLGSKMECDFGPLLITALDFSEALPFHFIFDEECRLVHAGKELHNHVPQDLLAPGTPILRIFELTRPLIPIDFDSFNNFINAVFVFQLRNSPCDLQPIAEKDEDSTTSESIIFQQGKHLNLKGQMMLLNTGKHMICLCSPHVVNLTEMLEFGMRFSSFPLYGSTRDLILLNEQRMSEVEVSLELEAHNDQMEAMARDLEAEKVKTDDLLRDILQALPSRSSTKFTSTLEATAMFSDVPDFQQIINQCPPKQIVHLLNDLFSRFDRLIVLHRLYKVETVGDSYMTLAGIQDHNTDHAEVICHAALGMIWEARDVHDSVTHCPLRVRIGIHTGPIVSGVVGSMIPRYCLFGDTVTTASRLEMSSTPGKIHLSRKAMLAADTTGRFVFQARGPISVRGKGDMETYFLIRSEKKSVWEIVDRERDESKNSIDGYEELEASGAEIEKAKPIVNGTATILNGDAKSSKWKDASNVCTLL